MISVDLETVPRAIASTPASFSVKTRFPLELGLECKCVSLKVRFTTTTAPARYFLAIYSETPWPEMPRNSGTALSPQTSSQITQAPTATTVVVVAGRQLLPLDTSKYTPTRGRRQTPNSSPQIRNVSYDAARCRVVFRSMQAQRASPCCVIVDMLYV